VVVMGKYCCDSMGNY